MYLLIRNPGEAPIESFTLIGASLTNGNGIGQFGSGTKLGLNALMRRGISVTVYSGLTKISFSTLPVTINDGIDSKIFQQVQGHINDGDPIPLWALEFGKIDWSDPRMGLREFVSNAIDRTCKQEDFREAIAQQRLCVGVVSDIKPVEGFTHIYIPFDTIPVRTFFAELESRYLHFGNPDLLEDTIIPHQVPGDGGRIYVKGVMAHQVSLPTLFDYNFNDSDIDESRNMNESICANKAARAISCADTDIVKIFIESCGKLTLDGEKKFWEHNFSTYALRPTHPSHRDTWTRAWTEIYGEKAIPCLDAQQGMWLSSYGYKPIYVPMLLEAILPVKKANEILSQHELKGMKTIPVPSDLSLAAKQLWKWLEMHQMIGEASFPAFGCFKYPENGDINFPGYTSAGCIWINADFVSCPPSKKLISLLLRFFAEHITNGYTHGPNVLNFFINFMSTQYVDYITI